MATRGRHGPRPGWSPETRAAVGGEDLTAVTISGGEVTLSTPTAGQPSEMADIRIPKGYVYAFTDEQPVKAFLYTHEQFTTDGTNGNAETFNLTNNIVQSAGRSQETAGAGAGEVNTQGAQNLVLYDSGTQVQPNTIDFGANQFTYEDAGSNSTLDVYYLWGEGSEVVLRHYDTAQESYDERVADTVRGFHTPNPYDRTEAPTVQGKFEVTSKQRLKLFLTAAVDMTNWDAINGGGPNNTTSFSYFELPCYKINAG